MSSDPRFVDGYDARDFGADYIHKIEDYKGSGYDHYTAYSLTGGQVSWNLAETANGESYVVGTHMSDRNTKSGGRSTVWD